MRGFRISTRDYCTMLGLVLLAVGGCREAPLPATDQSAYSELPSEEAIMAKVYDLTYSVPDGFYVDARAATTRGYELYHIKDESKSYERCTNVFDEAYEWEVEENAKHQINGVYVGSVENEYYFEFIRELSQDNSGGDINNLTWPNFTRVFKCTYIDRDGVQRQDRNGYAGKFGTVPVSLEEIVRLTEYLWQFTYFWPIRAVVLETNSAGTGNSVSHTLRLALLSRGSDQQCDRIEIADWSFSAGEDGVIWKELTSLHEFEARHSDGLAKLCPSS